MRTSFFMFYVASVNIIEYSYNYFNNALQSDVVASKNRKLFQILIRRWFMGTVALGLVCGPVRLLGQSSDGRAVPGKHQAEKIFAVRCAICHGADAHGGQYGPRLAGSDDLQGKPVSFFRNIIRNGIPSAGMPAFDLPDSELDAMAGFIQSLNVSAKGKIVAGDRLAGEKYFFGEGKCASCHMVYGRGSATGPDLSNIAGEMTVAEIRAALLDPAGHISPGYEFVTVKLQNGETLPGFVRSQSNFETALQDLEGQFHLLPTSEISDITSDKKSPMPPVNASSEELQNLVAYLSDLNGVKPGNTLGTEDSGSGGVSFSEILQSPSKNWLTYNGNISSNRYSPLSEINKDNVSQLQLKWLYTVPLWKQ
ncbi:MAG TPA: c-type cytochrome, partial [Acidobacteriaceae bacterium]|nr:c-type cytochrome [Acidobacteriaceae bacterium]